MQQSQRKDGQSSKRNGFIKASDTAIADAIDTQRTLSLSMI
jgi:hypothetical protein